MKMKKQINTNLENRSVHGLGWVGFRGFFDLTYHGTWWVKKNSTQPNLLHKFNPTQPNPTQPIT